MPAYRGGAAYGDVGVVRATLVHPGGHGGELLRDAVAALAVSSALSAHRSHEVAHDAVHQR